MKIKKYLAILVPAVALTFTACEEALEPNPETILEMEQIVANPSYAEGFLMKAYKGLNTGYNMTSDFCSSDLITNNNNSNTKAIVNGGWAADNNPMSTWNASFECISYLNTFIGEMESVEWSWESEMQDTLFARKLRGEAYALRAWYNFKLFKRHAGVGTSGTTLGLPILDHYVDHTSEDYQIPRATLDDYVAFMLKDVNQAIKDLPLVYKDGDYPIVDGVDMDTVFTNNEKIYYDRVMGARNTNRINGMAAKALKSYILLYAASPAFNSTKYTMQMAAEAAADAMNSYGGLANLSAADITFYKNNSLSENIWYSSLSTNQNGWESENFPPSLYGKGRANPTQNFVDAFPMIDGTPIGESAAFMATTPYANRDPRLSAYVIYNGSTFKGNTIDMADAQNTDARDNNTYSTKTSYYIKKIMNENVDLTPGAGSKGTRFKSYIRYTEVLLNFAEAANAAGGADAAIGGFTAREVINAIRSRAGITSNDYVDGLGDITDVIRNERRIELCFEEHRFFDIRRWKLTNVISETAQGIDVAADGTTYTPIDVEPRAFGSKPIYGPIPLDETLRYDIEQNKGW